MTVTQHDIDTDDKWTGLCTTATAASTSAQNPDSPGISWNLDQGDLLSWTRALQVCHECPFTTQCIAERQAHVREWGKVSAVIWAGVAYSDLGNALDAAGLRRRAAAHRGRRHRDDNQRRAVGAA